MSEKRNGGGIRKFAYRPPPGGTPSRVWTLNGERNVHQAAERRADHGQWQAVAELEKTLIRKRCLASKLPVVLSYIHSIPISHCCKGKATHPNPQTPATFCGPNCRPARIPAPQNRENSSKGNK